MTIEPFSTAFHGLDDRRNEIERHRQNSSRMAEAAALFKSVGVGSIEFERRVDFGLTFMRKPTVSYASELDVDELERLIVAKGYDAKGLFDGGRNSTPALPLVTGFVTDWDTDARGYYVGAFCAARIYYPPLTNPYGFPQNVILPVEVFHHFRFSAVGMKDVPITE